MSRRCTLKKGLFKSGPIHNLQQTQLFTLKTNGSYQVQLPQVIFQRLHFYNLFLKQRLQKRAERFSLPASAESKKALRAAR